MALDGVIIKNIPIHIHIVSMHIVGDSETRQPGNMRRDDIVGVVGLPIVIEGPRRSRLVLAQLVYLRYQAVDHGVRVFQGKSEGTNSGVGFEWCTSIRSMILSRGLFPFLLLPLDLAELILQVAPFLSMPLIPRRPTTKKVNLEGTIQEVPLALPGDALHDHVSFTAEPIIAIVKGVIPALVVVQIEHWVRPSIV